MKLINLQNLLPTKKELKQIEALNPKHSFVKMLSRMSVSARQSLILSNTATNSSFCFFA